MMRPFAATVWREGRWYVSQCLELNVASQGDTEEEALANLKEAIELHFEPPQATRPPPVRCFWRKFLRDRHRCLIQLQASFSEPAQFSTIIRLDSTSSSVAVSMEPIVEGGAFGPALINRTNEQSTDNCRCCQPNA